MTHRPKHILFLTCFMCCCLVFSQDILITTTFIQEGHLYQSLDKNAPVLTTFKAHAPCKVIGFSGNYSYKVKYNEFEGFVKEDDLDVNEAMMDLFFAYQKQKRIKLRQQEDARKKKIKAIQKEAEAKRTKRIEKTYRDSIARIEKERLLEQKRLERIRFRETCHYNINEYDPIYKERIVRTKPYNIAKNVTVELFRQGRKTDLFVNYSKDLGCASYLPRNLSHVKITLENKDIVTFYHSWDIYCDTFSFKGRLPASKIARLKKSPIAAITLKGTKSSEHITDIAYKAFFIDKLKCIE